MGAKMKKIKIVFLAALILGSMLIFGGCGDKNDSEITESIIEKFMELTEIPRPTKYEKEVSDFLKNWANEQGLKVVQDDYNNLIIEVPATEGMEDKPLVILQGHMDMVFAQADNLDLDPLTTKIEVINDGKYLKSDGKTSLGGDDGIGVAIMECIAEGKMSHGPLRLIITTDEEQESTGAMNLDKKYLMDANYLINLDDEIEGEIVISSASASDYTFSARTVSKKPAGNLGVEIVLSGLTGGHSGDEIHKGRLNGILVWSEILEKLKNDGIGFEVSELSGGNASNAIPTGSRAILAINKTDYEKLEASCNSLFKTLKERHLKTDPDMNISVSKVDIPDEVISASDTKKLYRFLSEKYNGVYTMSEEIEGLVESSTNTGIIEVNKSEIIIKGLLRSSSAARERELKELDRDLAKKLGYEIVIIDTSKAWPPKVDNILEKLAVKTYKDLFSKDINVCAIHAGLECGEFADKNPNISIIAMGPTITGPHTTKESIEIESIEKIWKLLEGILNSI